MMKSPTGPVKQSRNKLRSGLTLIELTFVLVLLGLMTAVAAPRISEISGASLRKTCRKMAALIRDTYDSAALENAVLRLQLNMDDNTYWVERYNEASALAAEAKKEEDIFSNKEENTDDPEAKFFSIAQDLTPQKVETGRGVKIKKVHLVSKDETVDKGKTFIQFYPDGSVDAADIYLTSRSGKRGFILHIHPLTGRVKIERGTGE